MKNNILKIKTIDGITHEIDIDPGTGFHFNYNEQASKQDKWVLFPQEIDNDFLLYCFDKLKIKKDDVFEIEFPKSITTIKPGTFRWFKNLRGVKFNGNIEEIGYNNFSHTVPDLKGIWFSDPDISNNLKSVSCIQDNIPKDLGIFGGPNGDALYSSKKNYQQFLENSKNRELQEVEIEFKLKDQTKPMIFKSEFKSSGTFNKYSCVLTSKLFKKILESASKSIDFRNVDQIKISGAKVIQIINLLDFSNLKRLEISDGTNYVQGLLQNNKDVAVILPKSLRPIVDTNGTVYDITCFGTPKYVIVNNNSIIKDFFKARGMESTEMKIFDTKDELERYLNSDSPDKNIYPQDFEEGELGTLPLKQVNLVDIYKPEISYLEVFDTKTVVSLIFFTPLGICFAVYNFCQISKQNHEIREENKKLEAQKTKSKSSVISVINKSKQSDKKPKPAFDMRTQQKIKNNHERNCF